MYLIPLHNIRGLSKVIIIIDRNLYNETYKRMENTHKYNYTLAYNSS